MSATTTMATINPVDTGSPLPFGCVLSPLGFPAACDRTRRTDFDLQSHSVALRRRAARRGRRGARRRRGHAS